MTPPEPFEWLQPDALRLLCTDCGSEVSADVVDLHLRECPGPDGGQGARE